MILDSSLRRLAVIRQLCWALKEPHGRLKDRLTVPAADVPDSDFRIDPETKLCPGVAVVNAVDSSMGEGIVNAVEVSDNAVCPVGSETSPDAGTGIKTADVLDVVMMDPAESVVVTATIMADGETFPGETRAIEVLDVVMMDPAESVVVTATTMADEETLPAETGAVEVLDVVIIDPAGFVVVYIMIVADDDCSKLEDDAVDVREVVTTDPAGFVVVKTTISEDGESTETEGIAVADVVKTDPLKSVVLSKAIDGEMVDPGIRTVLDVVTTDPAESVVVNATTIGDGERTETEGNDVVDTVGVTGIDPLESVLLNETVNGETVEPGIRNVPKVVITDPAEFVVANTIMDDDAITTLGCWTCEVLEIVATDPAESVVV